MNTLILSTSFVWTVAMSILLYLSESTPTKVIAFTIIGINVLTTAYHLITDNGKKSIELRVYADNIIVLLLIARFPKDFFYGYSIQILLSMFIAHLYLKNKTRVYKILILLIVTEMAIYFPLCSLKPSCQLLYNSLSMLLLLSVMIVIKNKLLLSPEKKYGKIISGTNNIIRHQIIECITPMYYYIRDLDESKKDKMERLITKLKYIAQNNTNNFGYIVSILKSTLHTLSKQKFNITLIDQTTKIIEIDSYTLLLVMYVICDTAINNQASEIAIKFTNKEIEINDNGSGFNIDSSNFKKSSLKTAIDLLQLYDFDVKYHSVIGAGTTIKILI
jgi:hypothetical protein